MAINKARTSPMMKAGVIILIIAFVGGIGVIGIGAFSGGTDATGGAGGRNTSSVNKSSGPNLSQISAEALGQINPNEEALKSKPNDYALLKTLGDEYSDWAGNVRQAEPNAGVDIPTWQRAADYYKKALAVKAGDPNVETDLAIALFYSQDVKGAIATAESVIKKNATFAPVRYNVGVFYRANGETQKAITAYDMYLKLEPNGGSAADAKKALGELRSPGN